MKIGSLELSGRYFLAPMAGVTDLPFRILCNEYGAALTCTEMISAKAITYGNKKTEELMKTDDGDHPLALQLFGSDPAIIAEAVSLIGHVSFEVLDINMGCPMPKIVNNGEGSALMKDPELVYRIVEAARGATSKPVTVKIRAGYDSDNINAVEIALAAQDGGVSAITVHGRTREQMYEGRADWEIIRKVKEMVHVPVIGNGDVTDAESAQRMFDETGCDAIAVGRAVRGRPWLFRELNEGKAFRPSNDEIRSLVQLHIDMAVSTHGEYIAVREMRKHVGWYTAGIAGSAALRDKINHCESADELKKTVGTIF